MRSVLKITIAPLLSLFIFILGNGLFSTLLALRLHGEGASTFMIGAMMGAYYAGLAYGSFKIEKFILNVGHIRAFAAFASFLAVISFAQGVFINNGLWLVFRFLGGFATAGIFVVIESWLLSVGSTHTRGRILAFYMISLYAGQALGQFMINLSDPGTLMLFALTAMLCSLAVIPLSLTKTPSPEISPPSQLNFVRLFKISGSGVIGCLCSGLILGSVYGLLPLIIVQQTGKNSMVALFMALVILGGMSLQYPVGKISDFIERRLVLLCLALSTIVLTGILIVSAHYLYLLYVSLFVFGGLVFTLYPVSISHACDSLSDDDIVSGTQGLLLAYSVGATLGPFITPVFIKLFGTNGLYVYIITVGILLAVFLSWRKASVPPTQQDEGFVPLPQTSPITAEMDPRGEGDN